MPEAPIDIHDPVAEICTRLGIHASYVAQLDLTPTSARAVLYRGRLGRCQGPKFVIDGKSAMETLRFEVRA